MPTHKLNNVSLCFRGVGKEQHEYLGQSSCNSGGGVSAFPEKVYMICGELIVVCLSVEVKVLALKLISFL